MKRDPFGGVKRYAVLCGALSFALSCCVLFHLFSLIYEKEACEVEITLSAQHLPPELCEALEGEQTLLLDGRFALFKTNEVFSPTLLRFYDSKEGCEFTVMSKKYSDLTLTLRSVGRKGSFGIALYGVRTVNKGMSLSLFGEKSKLFGTCIGVRIIED